MSSAETDEIREIIGQTFVAIGTLARALHVEDARLEPTLNAITAHAAAAHPAAGKAGLILLTGGKDQAEEAKGHERGPALTWSSGQTRRSQPLRRAGGTGPPGVFWVLRRVVRG